MTFISKIKTIRINPKGLLFAFISSFPLILAFILIIFMTFDVSSKTTCDWSVRERWECYLKSDK